MLKYYTQMDNQHRLLSAYKGLKPPPTLSFSSSVLYVY